MTTSRALYQAKSGLLAWRLSVTVKRGIGKCIVLGYLRQMDLSPSTNRDGPLLRQGRSDTGANQVLMIIIDLLRGVFSGVSRYASALAVLIFSLSGLPAFAEQDVRGKLDEIVVVFNGHARLFDIDAAESVLAFNAFIGQVLSARWDTEHMAMHLLSNEVYQNLNSDQQRQIRQSLETTFYRYAYEILDANKKVPLALIDDLYLDEEGQMRIKIRGKSQFLPALIGDLYLAENAKGWAIIDAGYAGFTYTLLKRRVYQRKFSRVGIDGLTAWLDEKNQRFFADYCTSELNSVMPARVNALCEAM